jgi:hypothetical protein
MKDREAFEKWLIDLYLKTEGEPIPNKKAAERQRKHVLLIEKVTGKTWEEIKAGKQ